MLAHGSVNSLGFAEGLPWGRLVRMDAAQLAQLSTLLSVWPDPLFGRGGEGGSQMLPWQPQRRKPNWCPTRARCLNPGVGE